MSTAIVVILIAVAVFFAAKHMKKTGGCDCGSCSKESSCHPKKG